MDNENSLNDPSFIPEPESGGINTVWKIAVAVVAVVIIGFFVYPLLQRPSNQGGDAVVDRQTTTTGSQTASELEGKSAQELFELGNSIVQSGQLQRAVEAYRKAIELDPDYQAAYANLGVVYYQLEQLDLAAQQYEKALELDPKDGDVAYNLGALKLQQALLSGGQPDPDLLEQAIDQLQQALELSPDLAEPHFSLGVAYAALNRTEDAIAAFERFLELDSGQDPRASQEARRYLESLKAQ